MCKDVLEDGGLKLAELGSCSPPVALGSDVAISLLLSDLQLGNYSAANKWSRVRSLKNTHLKYRFVNLDQGFDQ